MEKLVIICTCGPEDAERATLALAMATTGQASEMEVVLGLQADGVLLMKKGVAEQITTPEFPPFPEMLEEFIEGDGTIYLCAPCVIARQLDPEADLIPGARLAKASALIAEIAESDFVVSY